MGKVAAIMQEAEYHYSTSRICRLYRLFTIETFRDSVSKWANIFAYYLHLSCFRSRILTFLFWSFVCLSVSYSSAIVSAIECHCFDMQAIFAHKIAKSKYF